MHVLAEYAKPLVFSINITVMNSNFTRLLGWAGIGAGVGYLAILAVRATRQIDFREKVVLITGGSRGLGLLLARRLAAADAKVAICARDPQELERARRDLKQYGAHIIIVECDITYRADVDSMFQTIARQWGPVEILINNAGAIQVGPQEDMTPEDYQNALNVHYWGPLHTTLAALPAMRQRGQGRIVNIASIGGKISVPHLLPYCGSKFALVGLSEGMRNELIQHGIYVTTVCPGLMRTGSHVNAQFKGEHEWEYAWFSVGASAPLASMSAERAADQILAACRTGQAHVVLSLPAKLLSLIHGIAPNLVNECLSAANRLLPGSGGIGHRQTSGAHSRPDWFPCFITYLGDKAARRNNQLSSDHEVSAKCT